MQIGCGQTIKEIKMNCYLYFWRYEYSEGKSIQKYIYVGRADDPMAVNKANDMTYEYLVGLRKALDRLIEVMETQVTR
ncbi:MAG: hypothetical protein JSV43_01350 [Methanobacteriota archaeon]|nr:MAG: hypothetical protein JSV43_01350 [Euryarchaeota archaeon]